MSHWTLIVIAAVANIVLNLCLRQTGKAINTESVSTIVLGLFVTPWAWLSVLSAGVLLTAFVAAIRVYSLSLTYAAVTSIAMVGLTVVGVLLQFETVNTLRVAGLGLIVAGILVSAFA